MKTFLKLVLVVAFALTAMVGCGMVEPEGTIDAVVETEETYYSN